MTQSISLECGLDGLILLLLLSSSGIFSVKIPVDKELSVIDLSGVQTAERCCLVVSADRKLKVLD